MLESVINCIRQKIEIGQNSHLKQMDSQFYIFRCDVQLPTERPERGGWRGKKTETERTERSWYIYHSHRPLKGRCPIKGEEEGVEDVTEVEEE